MSDGQAFGVRDPYDPEERHERELAALRAERDALRSALEAALVVVEQTASVYHHDWMCRECNEPQSPSSVTNRPVPHKDACYVGMAVAQARRALESKP